MCGLKWMVITGCALAVSVGTLPAKEKVEQYKPNVTLGDGKDGRVFAQWIQATPDAPIKEVRAYLKKVKGGSDCFVNLRFGKKGETFEGGKRIAVTGDQQITAIWKVGASAGGQPLVMNAYKGEVLVTVVSIIR